MNLPNRVEYMVIPTSNTKEAINFSIVDPKISDPSHTSSNAKIVFTSN